MPERSNEDWVRELQGVKGSALQRRAHEDLANYLYVVAYNYLRLREADFTALSGCAPEELAALAQDFVQETLEQLARNSFSLLASYRQVGRFTSWAAQIVRNRAAQELRRSYWTRRVPLPGAGSDDSGEEPPLSQALPDLSMDGDPARRALQQQAADTLRDCLAGLSERHRLAVLNCLGEGAPVETVAQALDTTANAVYLILLRARRQLRGCLEGSGLDHTVLAVFA